MNLKRTSALVGVFAVGAMTLAACGSDDNSTGGDSSNAANTSVACGGKKALKASGASSQKNAMERFVAAYENNCDGYTLDYTSSGSGAGVNEFIGGQTDFAGSDSALSSKEDRPPRPRSVGRPARGTCRPSSARSRSTYNVDGVDDLVLDGPTAAKIFNGSVTNWNDPEITALNPDAKLPARRSP